MFNALRQGSPLYVMDKGNLTLKVGSVESVSQPTGFGNMPWMQGLPGQTIDVTVRFEDGSNCEFKQLQPNLASAVYGNVVVTETRELMAQEVDNMTRQSKAVIESVPYHNKVVASCDEMKALLSPQFAKEKETDKRLLTLERGMGDIKEVLDKIAKGMSPAKS